MVATFHLMVVPGDGIGPEVVREALKVARWFVDRGRVRLTFEEAVVGGAAIEAIGRPIADATVARAKEVDAILFGSVGGPEWDFLPVGERAGDGLLRLRKELDLFANLRPIRVPPALADATTLKPEVVRGLDFLIIRELTGGIYFGQPRGVERLADGGERGFNTEVYTTGEVRRVAAVAFEIARRRGGHVHSVDKANVLDASQVWRRAITALHAEAHRDVPLFHMLVDNCALQLVRHPAQFDVMVMGNMFGDILSDGAAALTGSLGMLPSASIGQPDAQGRYKGLFEPIHGTAPDIAGQGKANPAGMILSLAMLFDFALGLRQEARAIVDAVDRVLDLGVRTVDLASREAEAVGTAAFGDAVLAALDAAADNAAPTGGLAAAR